MTGAIPRRVAVVGSGVAGLTAAHVLGKQTRVTLYEADARLGGHADTHVVDGVAVDTGFIVHNERTYPHLLRLFDELGVPTQDSEMSMSVRDDAIALEYAGALGLSGLFPSWRHALRPSYLRMLVEIPRFHRMAKALLASAGGDDDETLRSFLERGGF
ncbi:MAG: NAD(P)-binding protein, partial [Marmoricola sp.]